MSGDGPALRIAFDMDGVLADMQAALTIEAKQMFTASQALHLILTDQQTEALWERVAGTSDFWEGLAETEPGIVARLARLAEERKWEAIFLTQRPPTSGSTVQTQTQRWLRRHGFEMPSVYTTRGSRGAIASALHLDVVVDDRFEGCVDVAGESKARAVLVSARPDARTRTRAKQMGITVVPSVSDCLDLLERNDSPSSSASGLMSRLRRIFRRRTPPATG